MSPFRRAASRVSTIELLFDLVFVFMITQVTEIVVDRPDGIGVAQAVLVLAIVWWMYDAFAWLTNQNAPETVLHRIGLIVAMAAFLVLALAIPDAFGDSGLLFGAVYLAIVLIHGALFSWESGTAGILRVAPFNLAAALLLIVSGFLTGPADWVLFPLAIVAFLASSVTTGRFAYDLGASHFVERHGLFMIIAFGESVVSVGVGAVENEIHPPLIAGTVVAVFVIAAMWWCYFGGDDERASEAFSRSDPRHRATLALSAYYLDHLVMIFGLVLFAAGVKLSIADVFAPASVPAAWLLAGGVTVYLAGDATYRHRLSLGPAFTRIGGAVLAAATGFLGLGTAAIWQLVALVVVLVGIVVAESFVVRRSAES